MKALQQPYKEERVPSQTFRALIAAIEIRVDPALVDPASELVSCFSPESGERKVRGRVGGYAFCQLDVS